MRINLYYNYLSLTFLSSQLKIFLFASFHSYLSIPTKRSVRVKAYPTLNLDLTDGANDLN